MLGFWVNLFPHFSEENSSVWSTVRRKRPSLSFNDKAEACKAALRASAEGVKESSSGVSMEMSCWPWSPSVSKSKREESLYEGIVPFPVWASMLGWTASDSHFTLSFTSIPAVFRSQPLTCVDERSTSSNDVDVLFWWFISSFCSSWGGIFSFWQLTFFLFFFFFFPVPCVSLLAWGCPILSSNVYTSSTSNRA